MHRPFLSGVLFLALIGLTAGACSKNSDTPTTPTTPTVPPIQEPAFTGTLNINGASTFPFVTSGAGIAIATIASLDPDPTGVLAVNLSMGTWNGTSCHIQIETPLATAGGTVTGEAAGVGALCVRIADAGQLTENVTFTINIVHF